MHRAALVIFLVTLLASGTPAQTVTVRDAQSLEPLSYVTVYSLSPPITINTDGAGQADLASFQGVDTLRFRYLGYHEAVLTMPALRAVDFKVYLQRDPLPLSEVVVAANRWEQDRREVPFSIEHINPREVGLLQPQTAADLLGATDRIYIQKSQLGGGSPMIRGFAANRILLVVDGVRMNNAIFRSGNLQNVISLDAQALEEAEVILGPASVIYGSDALGGVMDFHTLDPPLPSDGETRLGGHGSLRYATANQERTLHADMHLAKSAWGVLSSVTLSRFGDQRMGRYGPEEYLRPSYVRRIDDRDSVVENENPRRQVPSGYGQLNLMQKVRFHPNEAWDVRLGAHYSTTTDVPRYDRLIERRGEEYRSAQWYYGPQRWFMTNLAVRHRADSPFFRQAKAVVAYQFMAESRHDRSFGSTSLRHRWERVRGVSVNLDFDAPISPKLDLFYGAEGVFNRVGSEAQRENIRTGSTAPTSTRYPDGSQWSTASLYASLKANLDPRLTLMAGLRYAQVWTQATFDTTFFDFPIQESSLSKGALTGSLGAVYRPSEDMAWHLNAATGYRAPNIDDIGKVFDSEPGAVVVPNPDLSPEYAYNLDLAMIRNFGGRVRLELAAFHVWLDQAMVRRDFQLDGQDSLVYDGTLSRVQAIQNAAEARIWGFEGRLEWRVGQGFRISSRFTWQAGTEREAEEEQGVPPRHVPPFFGATHVRYRANRLDMDLFARYNGAVPYRRLAPSERNKPHLYAVDEDGNPFAPAWYTLNLAVGYRVLDYLRFEATLENITDQRYRTYSSGIAAPGRNLVLALRASW